MMKRSRKRLLTGELKEHPIVVDVLVSSDDSEILISSNADSSLDLPKFNITLAVGFKFGSLFPEIEGVYEAVKTTSLTLLVSEFNSDFTFQKTA